MGRLPWQHATRQEHETSDLLHTLLHTPVSDSDDRLRPVALQSLSEQRRQTLSRFLRRTWFDRLLVAAERLLLLALVGFSLYWLLDGYGRDWLHAWQQRERAAMTSAVPAESLQNTLAISGTSTLTETLQAGAALPADVRSTRGVALPFVPDTITDEIAAARPNHAQPDYLAPRGAVQPPVPADPRPQRLRIPALELDTPVQEVFVEEGVWQVADYAAGYHHGSALPGEDGNTVMAGHAGLRGAVFRDLGSLSPGDEVLLEAGHWRYRYRVSRIVNVWPTQVEFMEPTPTPVLTLITCTAWDTRRLVVVADLVDSSPL